MEKETRAGPFNKWRQWRIPENCPLLDSLKMNAEVKRLYSASVTRKDTVSPLIQEKIGRGLSAIGFIMDKILKGEQFDPKENILPALVDSGKRLCDSHYLLTKHRKYEILLLMNETLKKITETSASDCFLFFTDLPEDLKQHKLLKMPLRIILQTITLQLSQRRIFKLIAPSFEAQTERLANGADERTYEGQGELQSQVPDQNDEGPEQPEGLEPNIKKRR